MEISMSAQNFVLIYSGIIGVVLGIIYDIFRIQRIFMENEYKYIKHKKPIEETETKLRKNSIVKNIIIFFEDITFFIISSLIITIFIFHANSGQIRWFALFGAIIGFYIYYITLGKIVMLFSEYIILFIRTLILYLIKYIVKPILSLINFIFLSIKNMFAFLYKSVYNSMYHKKLNRYSQNSIKKILHEASKGFKML